MYRGLLNNTILIFSSDNGGMITSTDYSFGALNTPLRGGKKTHFEGGIRVIGLLWKKDLPHKGEVYTGLMHAVDWLPTIASFCNVSTNGTFKLDGVDMSDSLIYNKPSKRNHVYINSNLYLYL